MKRKMRASAVALVLVASMWVQACTSTATYKAAGLTITAVDLAMNAWGEWVRAGKADATQEAAVRKAHDAYREAINIAEKATLAYYASANKDPKALRAIMDAVIQAGISVITVINSYRAGVPPIPVPTVERMDEQLQLWAMAGTHPLAWEGR